MTGAARAAEEPTHIFDATLSLTGDCTTSTLDPVPDPGCPGGAHPSFSFSNPSTFAENPVNAAVDDYGDIFVAVPGTSNPGDGSRIDVFAPSGLFIDEIKVPNGLAEIAVDRDGHIYARTGNTVDPTLLRFDPTVYNPAAAELEYASPPVTVFPQGTAGFNDRSGIAVDPSNGHLYVLLHGSLGNVVGEYGSAGEGNALIETGIGAMTIQDRSSWLTVDGRNHDVYVSNAAELTSLPDILVFDGEAPGHPLKRTIDGSNTPAGHFTSTDGHIAPAIEESDGHLFVEDIGTSLIKKPVYEFAEDGSYVGAIEHRFEYISFTKIAIDNGTHSPNNGYLFVAARSGNVGHLYAFEPKREPKPPIVESVAAGGVTEDEAELRATVNPDRSATHYRFELVTAEAFAEEGFATPIVVGEGDLPAGNEGIPVSASAAGLSAATSYRFRVVAESQCEPGGCSGEGSGAFRTFAPEVTEAGCPNASLRSGASSALPDCRAYELVTPPDTSGRAPYAPGVTAAGFPGSPPASRDGGSLGFAILGGALPGYGATGSFNGDLYVASRTEGGWETANSGPTGEEAVADHSLALSPDHGYSLWGIDGGSAQGEGSLPTGGESQAYVRMPGGTFELLAQGSLGSVLTQPNLGINNRATPERVTESGAHILFSSLYHLEPNAAPAETQTLYDRTAGGETRVISLLPGEVPLGAHQYAEYKGSSQNGKTIAFTANELDGLYVRVDNAETLEVTSLPAAVAGMSADGRFVFYTKAGNLYRFDTETQQTLTVADSGDARVVNIPGTGTTAYFLSQQVIPGSGASPSGAVAQAGKENLYLWDGVGVRFVGTLLPGDVNSSLNSSEIELEFRGGLGEWANGFSNFEDLAVDPSRSTSDGTTLLFEARADLTGESSGETEVYRYDAVAGSLTCISCGGAGGSGEGGATLVTVTNQDLAAAPLTPASLVPNLSLDGRRAFFQTREQLVLRDTDGVQDVYEWEADGTGSCSNSGGCVYLISSGHSPGPAYLFGASASGDDVFFATPELLVGADRSETMSVYDARVDGGFAPPSAPAGECLGEACQPAAVAPDDPTPASSSYEGPGNVQPPKRHRCRKGSHRVKRGKATRCVRRHRKHQESNKRAHAKRRTSR
jgi:hypothetical protein